MVGAWVGRRGRRVGGSLEFHQWPCQRWQCPCTSICTRICIRIHAELVQGGMDVAEGLRMLGQSLGQDLSSRREVVRGFPLGDLDIVGCPQGNLLIFHVPPGPPCLLHHSQLYMNGRKGQPDVKNRFSSNVVDFMEWKSKSRSSMQSNRIRPIDGGTTTRRLLLQDLFPGMGIVRQRPIGDPLGQSSMFGVGMVGNPKEKFDRFSKPQDGPVSCASSSARRICATAGGGGRKGSPTDADTAAADDAAAGRRPMGKEGDTLQSLIVLGCESLWCSKAL